MEHRRHYLISGRVQGVGFRRFVQKRAREIGVRGWVRNLADGRVEAVARGSAEQLERLEVYLKRGPMHSQVNNCIIEDIREEIDRGDFDLIQDGEGPWPKE